MLGSRHSVSIDPTQVLLEVRYPYWHLLGCHARPQRWLKTDHQVHPSGRHARFFQAGNYLYQGEWIVLFKEIELQITVRACPQREDPALCDTHGHSSCERDARRKAEQGLGFSVDLKDAHA